jgi:hypothetical protein
MWTPENRHRYDRDQLRYPSDLTDAEWQHIEPLIPPAKQGGGKRTVDMREVVNAVMYVLSTGCQWCGSASKRDPLRILATPLIYRRFCKFGSIGDRLSMLTPVYGPYRIVLVGNLGPLPGSTLDAGRGSSGRAETHSN